MVLDAFLSYIGLVLLGLEANKNLNQKLILIFFQLKMSLLKE